MSKNNGVRKVNPNIIYSEVANYQSHEEEEFLDLLSSAWVREHAIEPI